MNLQVVPLLHFQSFVLHNKSLTFFFISLHNLRTFINSRSWALIKVEYIDMSHHMNIFISQKTVFFPPILRCPVQLVMLSAMPLQQFGVPAVKQLPTKQSQQKLFRSNFLPSSVICLSIVAPVLLLSSSTAQEQMARHCCCPCPKGEQASPQGYLGLTRLAWLLCRCGGSGDFRSLQTLPTAGPLHTPYALPFVASPSR